MLKKLLQKGINKLFELDIGLLVIIVTLLVIIMTVATARCPYNYKTYIPKNAYNYMDLVELDSIILNKNINLVPYFDALIEQESCVTLCSKKCWNPKARLKTKREEGAGLFQITRVFYPNGLVKWDMLRYLKLRYPKYLKDLTWKNIYNRPDLQILAGMLLWKSNMPLFIHKVDKDSLIWFLDSCYNGGFKYLYREMTICKLTKGCNPRKWFGNVAKIKSRRALHKLYGNRTAWDINRQHVKLVRARMQKYKKLFHMIYWYTPLKKDKSKHKK